VPFYQINIPILSLLSGFALVDVDIAQLQRSYG
jgi:hypothetical protein